MFLWRNPIVYMAVILDTGAMGPLLTNIEYSLDSRTKKNVVF